VAGAERWWLFLVPSGVVVVLVMVYPLTYAINLSFSNYDLGSGSHAFIGLRNYASLLTDQRF
jgi:ABC-type sugar transport system permease subunit